MVMVSKPSYNRTISFETHMLHTTLTLNTSDIDSTIGILVPFKIYICLLWNCITCEYLFTCYLIFY